MNKPTQDSPRWIAGVEPAAELLTASGAEIFELECRQQPKCLQELLHSYSSDVTIRTELKTVAGLAPQEGPVAFIGMGASLCSALAGSVMLQSHGKPSFAADAGEWLHYAAPVWNNAALSVLLTTSGESAELVELMKKSDDTASVIISNNPVSTCWKLAEHHLPILAGPEYGNATKTYTNAAAASIILASELLGRPWEPEAYHAADIFSKHLVRVLAMKGGLERFCRGAANIEIIGRGAGYGAAVMGALCIREMSGLRAAAHTGAGFKHGPILDVDGSHVAIILALGRVAELGIKLASECTRRGGRVVLVSASAIEETDKLFPVRIDAVAEPWESITSLLVPQALTLGMIERNGCRLPPRFQYGVMEQ